MKPTHITIKDIARILGVSPSTVSRALKDHPDISEETRNLVKTFAEKVKYRPNARLTEALGAVDDDKRRSIRQVAGAYMQKNHIKPPVRFDIIEITRAGVLYMKGNPS